MPETPPAPPPPAADAVDIPAKFKNADGTPNVAALAKSYLELEKKSSAGGNPAAPETPRQSAKDSLLLNENDPGDNLLTMDLVLKRSGLKPADIEQTWREKGDLTPQQYSALGRAGFSKDFARQIVKGIAAEAALEEQAVLTAVSEAETVAGGKDELGVLREWYKANGDKERLARFDAQIKNDPKVYPDIARLMLMEYTAKNGTKPQLVAGEKPASAAGGAATSAEEYAKLVKAYARGDQAAKARIEATPLEVIQRNFQ